MARIKVLPKHMADLIAAGEVVERPASVVKEIMENSIDAGASSITVEIKRGGITYIRVTDNGCGIPREDIRNAFKSHATSKVFTEDDLKGIGTLGFRGEALASIAAVSKVDILTKTPDSDSGTLYKTEGSEEILLDDAGCPDGTTIIVRDIFFNTPARMKFLKKDVTEGNAVAGVVDRIALSHPEISVRFIRDDKQQLVTPGNGKLSSCVYAVFGKDFSNGLIETSYELSGIKVSGLVSRPTASRSNRSMQFFFLNGRLVKSVTACAALEQAYKNAIMVGKFPSCVLNIEAPLDSVDVNVHPAKTEVRFENEKRIFDAVYYAVKSAIDEKDKPTKIDLVKLGLKNRSPFEADEGEQIAFKKNPDFWSNELPKSMQSASAKAGGRESQPMQKEPSREEKQAEPRVKQPPKPFVRENEKETLNSETVYSEAVSSNEVHSETVSSAAESSEAGNAETVSPVSFKIIGEAFNTYVLAECDNKILLIDKHAAHERMLFEKLKEENSEMKSQVLLEPVAVTLSKEEYSVILSNKELLAESGYNIDDFGSGCVLVRECPVMLIDEDLKSVTEELAGYLLASREPTPEKLNWIYHNTACRAAIKAGDRLGSSELEALVRELMVNPQIRYCPHGRPIMVELTKTDLEKQFGRIV